MARFELTMSNGETVLIDFPVTDITELRAELVGNTFLVGTEVKVGATTTAREVIVACNQVTLARPADSDSRQSSTFRPKR
jgi:hypothetical protein